MKRYTWIISIHNSDTDGVKSYCVNGTTKQVENHLWELCQKERKANYEMFDCGTDTYEDICNKRAKGRGYRYIKGDIYCYNCFFDSHTDYVATRWKTPIEL